MLDFSLKQSGTGLRPNVGVEEKVDLVQKLCNEDLLELLGEHRLDPKVWNAILIRLKVVLPRQDICKALFHCLVMAIISLKLRLQLFAEEVCNCDMELQSMLIPATVTNPEDAATLLDCHRRMFKCATYREGILLHTRLSSDLANMLVSGTCTVEDIVDSYDATVVHITTVSPIPLNDETEHWSLRNVDAELEWCTRLCKAMKCYGSIH